MGVWGSFIIGLFIGSFAGIVIMALLIMAKQGDNYKFFRQGE